MQHIRSTLVNIYPRAVQYTYTILPNHGRRLNHRLYRWSELPPLGPCCVTAWRSGWQTIFHYVNGGRLKAASLVLAFRTLLPVSHFYTAQRYTSLSLPHLHYRQSHNNTSLRTTQYVQITVHLKIRIKSKAFIREPPKTLSAIGIALSASAGFVDTAVTGSSCLCTGYWLVKIRILILHLRNRVVGIKWGFSAICKHVAHPLHAQILAQKKNAEI